MPTLTDILSNLASTIGTEVGADIKAIQQQLVPATDSVTGLMTAADHTKLTQATSSLTILDGGNF